MKISLIAAVNRLGVIGDKGEIPWYDSQDFKHFKRTTLGHDIIMGRLTMESIGRPLPKRNNIVISRIIESREGYIIANDPWEALRKSQGDKVFVIGGSFIYRAFLPIADELYISCVDDESDGDTYFPPVDWPNWDLQEISDISDMTEFRRYTRSSYPFEGSYWRKYVAHVQKCSSERKSPPWIRP